MKKEIIWRKSRIVFMSRQKEGLLINNDNFLYILHIHTINRII
jgi:hypothetical protein